ncbi:MAG: hypothetical protein IIX54_04405, partial [Clostridia bacterium]|nr:hypothetical protein [Clostridia bacterium]
NLHKKEQKRVQKEKDFVLSIINYNCCQSIAANNFYDKEEERHNREIRRSYNKIHKNFLNYIEKPKTQSKILPYVFGWRTIMQSIPPFCFVA